MAATQDQDRFFSGQIVASTPSYLLGEGDLVRMVNGRFVEGAITNAICFEEFEITFQNNKTIPATTLTYQDILSIGDVQLVAPLQNTTGTFLVMLISGVLFQVDLDTHIARDITPVNAMLPPASHVYPVSYMDNDGGVYAVGGYLVIFNGNNRPIFVTTEEARVSNPIPYEMPPARMGATAGNRAFVVSAYNIMYASDPFGGANPLAPLTFQETYPGGTYAGQVFRIGPALEAEYVTAVARLPVYLSANQDFLARNLLLSTNKHKYIIAASSPRDTWDQVQFISYAGSGDGIAGPLAVTNVGDTVFYISSTGRIKTLSQDQERETALAETYIDHNLGQFLCDCESQFYHRDWYRTLDHSKSVVKFAKDRVYATVYPISVPAIDGIGRKISSPSHMALAVGSIDPLTRLGPTANISWEGFYDWMPPTSVVTTQDDLYVVSKDEHGRIHYYKENFPELDDHPTTVYTRAYFAQAAGRSKSVTTVELYFRVLAGPIEVSISYLINNKWICGPSAVVDKKSYRFNMRNFLGKTEAAGIPLKIFIDHKGCRFELESIRLDGEALRDGP